MLDLNSALAKVKAMLATQFDATLYAPLEKAIHEFFSLNCPWYGIYRDRAKNQRPHSGDGHIPARNHGHGLLLLRKGAFLNDKNIETLKRAANLDPSKSGIFVTMKK